MKKHSVSHLDHGLTQAQIDHLLALFADRREFFIETVELPHELGTVPCGLWGPAMGDKSIDDGYWYMPSGEYIIPSGTVGEWRVPTGFLVGSWKLPIFDGVITIGKRGARTWDSRLINAPMRPSREVTVIAGPHEDEPCIIYTMYGGAYAPQEPTDPKISPARLDESRVFWAVHALSRYGS